MTVILEDSWQNAYKEITMRYSKLSLLIPCALALPSRQPIKTTGRVRGPVWMAARTVWLNNSMTIVSSTAVMISPPCALI